MTDGVHLPRLTKSKASLPLPLSEVTRGCSEGSWPLPPTPALSGEGTAYSPRVSETPPGHLHASTDQSCLPRDAPATQLGAELSNKQHLCPPPAEPCTAPLPPCRRGGEPTAANLVQGAGASPHHGSCLSHRTERKSPPCHAPTASCPGFQGASLPFPAFEHLSGLPSASDGSTDKRASSGETGYVPPVHSSFLNLFSLLTHQWM
ncbi:hypothetical protein EI555_009499, partial [Monodon monoceros]